MLWSELAQPLAYALLPRVFSRALLEHACAQTKMAHEAVRNMVHQLPHYLPHADLEKVSKTLRCVHFIDHADAWASVLRIQSHLSAVQLLAPPPPPGEPALILSAHWGNGWWTLPTLARPGHPVHFVSAPSMHIQTDLPWWLRHYLSIRWKELNRLGGCPIVPMQGAVRSCANYLSLNHRVVALLDIPPSIARTGAPVRFLGRVAYMPLPLVQQAFDMNVKIYYSSSWFNNQSLCHQLDFKPLESASSGLDLLQQYASYLEADIIRDAGAWHCWGHVDEFFTPPA
jgi:hypothetical protein